MYHAWCPAGVVKGLELQFIRLHSTACLVARLSYPSWQFIPSWHATAFPSLIMRLACETTMKVGHGIHLIVKGNCRFPDFTSR